MKLPNREYVYIPDEKLRDYLLSETHVVGKSKAKFFRMFGFDETNIDILEQALINIAQTYDVVEVGSSLHGKKYVIDGKLNTPIKKEVKVRTIWIVDRNKNMPRFVTAYPQVII